MMTPPWLLFEIYHYLGFGIYGNKTGVMKRLCCSGERTTQTGVDIIIILARCGRVVVRISALNTTVLGSKV